MTFQKRKKIERLITGDRREKDVKSTVISSDMHYTVRPYQVFYIKILATGQILTLSYHFPLKQ